MNREAAVIAADSACSIGKKVYNTAQKIFQLRDFPIAITISGDAQFMGIPLKTLVELFNRSLKKEDSFRTLEDCSKRFYSFIERYPYESSVLCGEFERRYRNFLDTLDARVERELRELDEKGEFIDKNKRTELSAKELDDFIKSFKLDKEDYNALFEVQIPLKKMVSETFKKAVENEGDYNIQVAVKALSDKRKKTTLRCPF